MGNLSISITLMGKGIGLLILAIALGGCTPLSISELTIAVASNLQFAMPDLIKAFTQSTGISCRPIVSSSGKLTAQIKAGAPFDLFLSADLKYPNLLSQEGLTHGKPQVYAHGTLVLWTMAPNIHPSLENLEHEAVRHIGVANPKTAPYGIAAVESLQALSSSPNIQKKLIYGESIAQVNQFVSTQVAEIGFTAKSVVVSSTFAQQGRWQAVDAEYYTPIAQGVVVLKNDRGQKQQAQQLQSFLFSSTAQTILKHHGYTIPKP